MRNLAETCSYQNSSEETRDHFIYLCHFKSLKEKHLRETNVTLEKCLEIGRSDSTFYNEARVMSDEISEKREIVNLISNK